MPLPRGLKLDFLHPCCLPWCARLRFPRAAYCPPVLVPRVARDGSCPPTLLLPRVLIARDDSYTPRSQRDIVGPDPTDERLKQLLAAHNYDVAAAANAYFDGDSAPIHGTPVGPPPPSEPELMQVTVPAGMRGGQELRVETPSGAMRCTIPAGLTGGGQFLVRPPAAPVAVARPARGLSATKRRAWPPSVSLASQPEAGANSTKAVASQLLSRSSLSGSLVNRDPGEP